MSRFVLATVLSVLLVLGGCVFGCGSMLSTSEGKLDVEQTRGLVQVLKEAGFAGQFNLNIDGEGEGIWMTGVRVGSPGTHLSVNGHMNPALGPTSQPAE